MSRYFSIIFLLQSFLSFGQYDTAQFPLPMKNRLIYYESSYNAGRPTNKQEVISRIKKWFADTSVEVKKKLKPQSKLDNGISGTVTFKVSTNDNGNYYWMRSLVTIAPTDSGYTYQSYNFFEKPTFPGITNDWSKIEYRWWDFRRGKPWSADDARLFKGIHATSLSLIDSLEKEVTR